MNQPGGMRTREGAGGLPEVVEPLGERARRIVELLAKRHPVHVLHRDVPVAARFADVVHRGDVGVAQRGRHLRFARKAGTEVRRQRCVCEHLERDVPLETRIECFVDIRAASGPEQLEDLVLAQRRSGRKKLAVLYGLQVVDAGLTIEQVNGVVVLFQEQLDFLAELRISLCRRHPERRARPAPRALENTDRQRPSSARDSQPSLRRYGVKNDSVFVSLPPTMPLPSALI